MNSTPHPRFIKILTALFAATTLGLALFPEGLPFLGLSKLGIETHFYWQWLTYGLFEPAPRGIGFSLLLQLGFSLYLFWLFGSSLIEALGERRFIYLSIGCTLAGGLGAWGMLKALHLSYLFAGLTPLVYGLLFAWTRLNRQATILLFFAIPINASRALYILIGLALLTNLSDRDWPAAASLLSSLGCVYLLSKFFSPTLTPIPWLRRMEWTLVRWKNRIKNWWKKPAPSSTRQSKIYDIRSGKPILDDEQFMDAMLARISVYGENSLSPEDRKRLNEISKKKKN